MARDGFQVEFKGKWHGDAVMRELSSQLGRGLHRAAEYLRTETVKNLRHRRTRTQGPSEPGQFPAVDTGQLSQSLFAAKLSNTESIVGFTAPYGLTHELGLRPFLLRTLNESKPTISRLVKSSIRLKSRQ